MSLKGDLQGITSDDQTPIDAGILNLLVDQCNATEDNSSTELISFTVEFLHERLYEESLNVKRKSLMALHVLLQKAPPLKEVVVNNADLISAIQELLSFVGGPDGDVKMIRDAAASVLAVLGGEGGDNGNGPGKVSLGLGSRLGKLKKGVSDVSGRVSDGITTVGGGINAVGTKVSAAVDGVAEGVVGMKEGHKLERERADLAGVSGSEISAAKRFQEIVLKHGHECLLTARRNAANGHQVMANVMLTLEMIHIQQASSEEKMGYLSDEEFNEISSLYEAIAQMESALRSHNMMKMAIYGCEIAQPSEKAVQSITTALTDLILPAKLVTLQFINIILFVTSPK